MTGERLIELSFINQSLMWLAACIQSLGGSGASGVSEEGAVRRRSYSFSGAAGGDTQPISGRTLSDQMRRGSKPLRPPSEMSKFRNSKLTLLLSNALSGNSWAMTNLSSKARLYSWVKRSQNSFRNFDILSQIFDFSNFWRDVPGTFR